LKTKRSKILRATVVIGFVAFSISGLWMIDTRSISEREVAWARSQKGPQALAQFDSLSTVAGRKALMRTQTPEELVGLWKEHLIRVLNERPLTNDQRAFINEVMVNLTPAVYRDKANVPEFFKGACVRISKLFGENDGISFEMPGWMEGRAVMMARQNELDRGWLGWRAAARNIQESIGLTPMVRVFAQGSECNCANSTHLASACTCNWNREACNVLVGICQDPGGWIGCGCLGVLPCNAICYEGNPDGPICSPTGPCNT